MGKNGKILLIIVLALAFVFCMAMAASESEKYPDVDVDTDSDSDPQEGGDTRPATTGERNALDKARSLYRSTIVYYSEQGMRDSLVDFYGFTEAEAKYAIAHLDADWQSQADKQAKRYLKQHIGPEGLVYQLTTFHDYPEDQARKAVEHLGDVDWAAEAKERAKTLRDERKYSRAWAEDSLLDEGYTTTQVSVALDETYGSA